MVQTPAVTTYLFCVDGEIVSGPTSLCELAADGGDVPTFGDPQAGKKAVRTGGSADHK